MSKGNPFDRQRRPGDPGDTRQFLKKEGWELIDTNGGRERWTGKYENGDKTMKGGLLRTASGKRKFYVKNPTKRFWKKAHSGGCFLKPWNTVENAYEVHFDRKPEAWSDGIRRIEQLL